MMSKGEILCKCQLTTKLTLKKIAAKTRLVSVLVINLWLPLQNHAQSAYYPVNPRKQGREIKQINLTFTNRTFSWHRSKNPSCLLYPPATPQLFKQYLLDARNRCTGMYLHAIINASLNLLSNSLTLRTLKQALQVEALHVTCVPLLRSLTTQVMSFSLWRF